MYDDLLELCRFGPVLGQWTTLSQYLNEVMAGEYVSGTGQSTAGLGAKVQYKFTKKFRLWATLSGQRDLDEQGNPTRSGGVAMGAGYRF